AGTDLRAIDVALRVHGDSFRRARIRSRFVGIGDERRHRAVLRAADANAALPRAVRGRDGARLGVRYIDIVVLVDVNAARPAELVPRVQQRPVLVEDLDAIVAAIADEETAFGIHRQRVRLVQLVGARALASPRLE